jgi:hypothetical protein
VSAAGIVIPNNPSTSEIPSPSHQMISPDKCQPSIVFISKVVMGWFKHFFSWTELSTSNSVLLTLGG